ncbi:hypothetical protein ACFY4K_30950 [Streptomyces leeuwenhoekii]|jgi:hypothetical protein|uniref:Uncharacterized protein n=1 Tax=Streptomyces leeuwenhoekii TaxID=1437453 RepID=A0A0F7VVE3_STRLW|nr:hypothetical protein [Streptomyces leeuwenhoekii]CQR60946.1 Hypothetical Protein sle_14840 [Streptomyces leeuwenhoekii]
MELAGWVTLGTAAVAGGFTVLGHLFDQVPVLAEKMITAIRSVRAVRDEVKRSDRT